MAFDDSYQCRMTCGFYYRAQRTRLQKIVLAVGADGLRWATPNRGRFGYPVFLPAVSACAPDEDVRPTPEIAAALHSLSAFCVRHLNR